VAQTKPLIRGMANQQVPQNPSSSKHASAARQPAQAHGRKKRRIRLAIGRSSDRAIEWAGRKASNR